MAVEREITLVQISFLDSQLGQHPARRHGQNPQPEPGQTALGAGFSGHFASRRLPAGTLPNLDSILEPVEVSFRFGPECPVFSIT